MAPARIYCDYNATAPLRTEAREAMARALDVAGNPSSVHAEGRKARALVEGARETVAAAIGACRDDIAFTSGGTEAVQAPLRGALKATGDLVLVASGIEHDAVSSCDWPAQLAGDAGRRCGSRWLACCRDSCRGTGFPAARLAHARQQRDGRSSGGGEGG